MHHHLHKCRIFFLFYLGGHYLKFHKHHGSPSKLNTELATLLPFQTKPTFYHPQISK